MALLHHVGPCAVMPRLGDGPPVMPDRWGACPASSYRASFLLHLTCHLVASEVGNCFLNKTLIGIGSAGCSLCQHCYGRSKLPCSALQCTPATLLRDNHPKSSLSSAPAKFLLLIAISENPIRNFHQLGLCLQLSPVCPSCWKPFWNLTPFDCPPHAPASPP